MIHGPLDIDLSNPLGEDPLNTGLALWMPTLPQTMGGPYWYGLTGQFQGTLTGTFGAGSGWGATTRQGGFGCLTTTGANYVSIPLGTQLNQASPASQTVSQWIRYTSAANSFCYSGRNTSSTNHGMEFLLNGTGGTTITVRATNSATTSNSNSASGLNDGRWHHVVGVIDGLNAQVRLYLDGSPVGTPVAMTAGAFSIMTPTIWLGSRGPGSYFTGQFDDTRIWNRALGDAEVARYYQLSTQGYPSVLRRISPSPALWARASTPVAVVFSATLAAQALASSVTVAAPSSRTASFSATLAAQSLASSITVASPASRSAAFAATVDSQALASSITATSPGSVTAAFAATLAGQTLTSSVTTTAPANRAVAFAATLADQTAASSITVAVPGSITAAFAGTLDAAIVAASLAVTSPASRTASFAATAEDQGIAATITAAAAVPTDVTVGFAATMGGVSLLARAVVPSNLPASLPAALASLVIDSGLMSSLPGGFHGNQLPLKATYPCAVGIVREGRIESRTNSNDRTLVPVMLRVYDADPDAAYSLSAQLDSLVAGANLDFDGALVTKLLRDGEPRMGWQAARSPTGRIEYTERKYLCRVRRPSLSAR